MSAEPIAAAAPPRPAVVAAEGCFMCDAPRAGVAWLVIGARGAICGGCAEAALHLAQTAWLEAALAARAKVDPARPSGRRRRQPPLSGRELYTGDCCDGCGGFRMRRAGTCLLCDDCGTTSGCS